MEITPVTPRGYCKGVYRAIKIAKQTKLQYPDSKVTMLGMIVHNKYVVQACNEINIECVDDSNKTRDELLDEINEGVVIFTAHGVSDKVKQKAIAKGLITVDATCEDVLKTHEIIKQYNGEVIYIGKNKHPEAEGACGLSDHIHLVTSKQDILNLPKYSKVLVTNQTTMSILEIQELIDICKNHFKCCEVVDEICNATRMRQSAILNLKNCDCLIIVGDPHSNNSKKLQDLGYKAGIKNCYMIENSLELNEKMLQNVNNIAVSSGASTPTYLTEQVISVLKHYAKTQELIPQKININEIIESV